MDKDDVIGQPDCPGCGYYVPWVPASGGWKDYVPASKQEMVEGAFPAGSSPQAMTTTKPLTAYNYATSSPTGLVNWATIDPNLSPGVARAKLALPNANTAKIVTPIIIPEGTTILIGPVAGQTGTPGFGPYAIGGGFQIYIPGGITPK